MNTPFQILRFFSRSRLFPAALLALGASSCLFFNDRGSLPFSAASNGAAAPSNPLLPVLLALCAILALGRLFGALASRFRQPPVIGEILAGIALGPSLLGQLWPGAHDLLAGAGARAGLGVLGQLGVLLYMFQMGLEFDPARFSGRWLHVGLISHASIALPFLLGALAAIALYPDFAGARASQPAFSLFVGVAVAITALPVLARILDDLGLKNTALGQLALCCAVIDDVSAWCLLALILGLVQLQGAAAGQTALHTLVFITALWLVARPALARLGARDLSPGLTALILVLLVSSAAATEAIGIHAIFGAFFLGLLIPHRSRWAPAFIEKFRTPIHALLLPAFFALSGLRTDLRLLNALDNLAVCAAILAIAVVGKMGGSYLASRFDPMLSRRDSLALALLMNTRGLVELLILNIGLEIGVISPALFSAMVVMALATTLMTAPMTRLLLRRQASVRQPTASADT